MTSHLASAAAFVAGAIVAVITVWAVVGYPDVEHVTVPIHEARLADPETQRIELLVGSCNGAPRATVSQGPEHVEIEISAFRFKNNREDCLDAIDVFLNQSGLDPEPTELFDKHSGMLVFIQGQ